MNKVNSSNLAVGLLVSDDDQVIARPGMTFEQFQGGAPPFQVSAEGNMTSAKFSNVSVYGIPFSGVCLFRDVITYCAFVFTDRDGQLQPFSEEEEKRGEALSKWVSQTVGSNRTFEWGNIVAGYSRRDGTSSIGLMYKP